MEQVDTAANPSPSSSNSTTSIIPHPLPIGFSTQGALPNEITCHPISEWHLSTERFLDV